MQETGSFPKNPLKIIVVISVVFLPFLFLAVMLPAGEPAEKPSTGTALEIPEDEWSVPKIGGKAEEDPAAGEKESLPKTGGKAPEEPGVKGEGEAYGQRRHRKNFEREGGSRGTESAVQAGLRWLHFHQDKDGRWDGDGFTKNCHRGPCDGKGASNFDVALTGIALLAYLGNGHTHRIGKHKKNVRRGLRFLRCQQQADGQLGCRKGESWIYNHAVGLTALAEAYAITQDHTLKDMTQKALKFALDAQNPGLGWKYTPRGGINDTSVTSWMVFALKAARTADLTVPDKAFDGACAWISRVTASNGRTGYMRPGDRGSILQGQTRKYERQETMTAAAILSRIFMGQDKCGPIIMKGVALLDARPPVYDKNNLRKVNYYYWYCATNAMFQIGGKKWKKWNLAMKKAILPNQRRGGCTDGSWDPVGEWSTVGGRVYSTAINALTLEAYYRFKRIENVREK